MRLGYIHFAFLSQGSALAAEASECAADQDAFWEYHDLLFQIQSGGFDRESLIQLASVLNLDTQAFTTCFDSGKYEDLVASQTSFARSIGVQSTPTFLINGEWLIGAQPFESFQQVIEKGLK